MSQFTSGLIFGGIVIFCILAGGAFFYKKQNDLPPGIINEATFGGRNKRHKHNKNNATKRRKM